jgi:acetamidase/formamidase
LNFGVDRWCRQNRRPYLASQNNQHPLSARVRLGAATTQKRRRPDDFRLETPVAWTPEAWITFGFDEDLNEAALIAVQGMRDLMERVHELTDRDALALAGALVDLRVTQIVNGVSGVHARLPHNAIRFPT